MSVENCRSSFPFSCKRAALVLCLALESSLPAASGAAQLSEEAPADITKQIVSKELELMRFTTAYRMNSTKASRLKQWRMWLYNQAHFTINNAGVIHISQCRWKNYLNPSVIKQSSVKAGPTLLLIGHSILAGGLIFESCLDALNDLTLKGKRFDRNAATQHVNELSTEISNLLDSRQANLDAAALLSEKDRQILKAEGDVLKDIRDASVFEYAEFNTRAARWTAGRNSSQLISLAAASTGGFLGSLMGLEGAACHHPHWTGTAGLGLTLSGALIVTNPLLTRAVMIGTGKLCARSNAEKIKGMHADALANLASDREKLSVLVKENSGDGGDSGIVRAAAARSRIYGMEKELFDSQLGVASAEARSQNRELIERSLVCAATGGTKMAYGIQFMNAGYGFYPNTNTPAPKVQIRVGGKTTTVTLPKPRGGTNAFNKRLAEGATTFIPGTAIGMVDAAQAKARGEWQIFRQHGASAGPYFQNRMETIDKMKDQLNGVEQ